MHRIPVKRYHLSRRKMRFGVLLNGDLFLEQEISLFLTIVTSMSRVMVNFPIVITGVGNMRIVRFLGLLLLEQREGAILLWRSMRYLL